MPAGTSRNPAPAPASSHATKAGLPPDDHAPDNRTPDECLRCGYALTGIANDQACPECGLLAERSRRISDELHDTRPRWLRSLSRGIQLILASLVVSAALWLLMRILVVDWDAILNGRQGGFMQSIAILLDQNPRARLIIDSIMSFAGPAIFLVGAFLLTVREHYPPADHADRRLRFCLRVAAVFPLALLVFQEFGEPLGLIRSVYSPQWFVTWLYSTLSPAIWNVLIVGCLSVPLLLFERLRGLAKRAHSAHLAEHCRIVGITASIALLYIGVAGWMLQNSDRFGTNWASHSKVALVLLVLLLTFAILFFLWSIYLLFRFTNAFRRAVRVLDYKWRKADRSLNTDAASG